MAITKDTNEALLGGDRVRYRPPVRESNSTAGQARAQLLQSAAGLAMTVDKMHSEGQLKQQMEQERVSAQATRGLQTIFDENPNDPVNEKATEFMMGLDQPTRDVITEMYGDLESMRQLHEQGRIDRTMFAGRVEDHYRKASAARPGYQDEYRRLANSFLGRDFEASLNAGIFGLAPEKEVKDNRTPRQKAYDKRVQENLDYLLTNRADNPQAAQYYQTLPDDAIISMGSTFQTQEAETTRRKEQLSLLNTESEVYSRQVLSAARTEVSNNFANTEQMSFTALVNDENAPDPLKNPAEFGVYIQENGAPIMQNLEAAIENPGAYASQIYAQLGVDESNVNISPETKLQVEQQIREQAQRSLDLFTNPNYATALSVISKAMPYGETMELMQNPAFRRYIAAFPEGSEGLVVSLMKLTESNKLVDNVLKDFLGDVVPDNGEEEEGTPDVEGDTPVGQATGIDTTITGKDQLELLSNPSPDTALGAKAEQRVKDNPYGVLTPEQAERAGNRAGSVVGTKSISDIASLPMPETEEQATQQTEAIMAEVEALSKKYGL